MSMPKITCDNITYTTPTNTLIVGTIQITTSTSDDIIIPGKVPDKNIDIILLENE